MVSECKKAVEETESESSVQSPAADKTAKCQCNPCKCNPCLCGATDEVVSITS